MTPAVLLFALGTSDAPREPPPTPPNVVVPGFHTIALLTVMRATEAVIWPEPFAKVDRFGANYEEAFTRPPKFDPHASFMRWDGDSLFVNVVGHGLFGSEVYLRARQCRFGWAGSFAAAAASSALWEYAFEGNGVRPSAQDLVYTPLAGLALGELRYFIHHETQSAVVRALVDPFGELERAAGTEC